MNQSAADSHRISVGIYGEHVLSDQTCLKWFARFKSSDFDLDIKER